ncbi:MAG: NAD(+) diphosphatase [Wenzhouxiangella sp.]
MNDNHRAASLPLQYADPGIERAAELRDDAEWVRDTLTQPSTRLIATWRSQHLLQVSGPDAAYAIRLQADGLADPEKSIFLGLEEQGAVFVVDLSEYDDPPISFTQGASFVDLRRFGPLLNARDANLLAYARAMVNWHVNHRYCSRCGAPTKSIAGGHRRQCVNPDCAHISFPRTDPAIIVLVEHPCDDGGPPRCLLGRSARFPPGVYSTLAGFVEPGESLEQAVHREVLEEAGVKLSAVEYIASQPWPFPGSLMLGFHAVAQTTEIQLKDEELEDARWFARDEVENFGEWGDPAGLSLPRRDSIARFLIERWCQSVDRRC